MQKQIDSNVHQSSIPNYILYCNWHGVNEQYKPLLSATSRKVFVSWHFCTESSWIEFGGTLVPVSPRRIGNVYWEAWSMWLRDPCSGIHRLSGPTAWSRHPRMNGSSGGCCGIPPAWQRCFVAFALEDAVRCPAMLSPWLRSSSPAHCTLHTTQAFDQPTKNPFQSTARLLVTSRVRANQRLVLLFLWLVGWQLATVKVTLLPPSELL